MVCRRASTGAPASCAFARRHPLPRVGSSPSRSPITGCPGDHRRPDGRRSAIHSAVSAGPTGRRDVLRRERAGRRRHLVSGQRRADRQGHLPRHGHGRQAVHGGQQRGAPFGHGSRAKRRFVWEQAQPMASYLAIVDIDRFQHEQRWRANGIKIRTFKTDTTRHRDTLQALRKTPAMINYFEGLFGPYPFDAYGAVTGERPEPLLRARDAGDVDLPAGLCRRGHGGPRTRPSMVRRRGDRRAMARSVAGRGLRHLSRVALAVSWRPPGPGCGLRRPLRLRRARTRSAQPSSAAPQDMFADNTYYRGA